MSGYSPADGRSKEPIRVLTLDRGNSAGHCLGFRYRHRCPSRTQPMPPDDLGAAGPPANVAVAFGPYLLRANMRRLECDGVAVPLGDRAFDLLCVLLDHAGEIVANRELMVRVWGKVVVGAGSLRFHINALRNALAQ